MPNPFGVRGKWSANRFYWDTVVALVERPLCPLRRADCPLCRRGTTARCAGRSLCLAWYEGPFYCSPVLGSVIPEARGSDERTLCGRGSVLGLVPTERPWCRRDPKIVWSAHAGGNPSDLDRSAEQIVPADRCAREIVRILKTIPARSRRLNSTVRRPGNVIDTPF
jgi:hypothetical protein